GFERAQAEPGDSFHVRALFDRIVEGSSVSSSSALSGPEAHDRPLSFRHGDILFVDNTMFNGVPGQWRAWLVDPITGHPVSCGLIPSKEKVEEELLIRRGIGIEFDMEAPQLHYALGGGLTSSTTSGASSSSTRSRGLAYARRSFFRRKNKSGASGGATGADASSSSSSSNAAVTLRSSSSSSSSSSHGAKELASFCDVSLYAGYGTQDGSGFDATLREDLALPSYQRVRRFN
ncbi:unnamed protein product, partial [Notodromas monacha]